MNLDSKIRRIRAAIYDVIMATALVLFFWSAKAAVKLLDVFWKFQKLVGWVTTQRTPSNTADDSQSVSNLRPIDDPRV